MLKWVAAGALAACLFRLLFRLGRRQFYAGPDNLEAEDLVEQADGAISRSPLHILPATQQGFCIEGGMARHVALKNEEVQVFFMLTNDILTRKIKEVIDLLPAHRKAGLAITLEYTDGTLLACYRQGGMKLDAPHLLAASQNSATSILRKIRAASLPRAI